jgi:hypothetical protein
MSDIENLCIIGRLTHTLLRPRKTEIKLSVVAVFPLCKIRKDTHLNITATYSLVCLYIKTEDDREVNFFQYSGFSNFVDWSTVAPRTSVDRYDRYINSKIVLKYC